MLSGFVIFLIVLGIATLVYMAMRVAIAVIFITIVLMVFNIIPSETIIHKFNKTISVWLG